MPKVIFYQRPPQKKNGKRLSRKGFVPERNQELPIYIRYKLNGKPMDYPTGQSCIAANWNPKKGRCRNGQLSAHGDKLLNVILDDLEAVIKESYKSQIIAGVRPTIEVVRNALHDSQRLLKADRTKPVSGLLSLFQDFADGKVATNTASGKEKTDSTRTTYKTSLEHLKGFKKDVDFADINLSFRDAYIDYLRKKGFGPNGIWKEFKSLKAVLNYGLREGLHSNAKFQAPGFSVQYVKSTKAYLTEAEIEMLYRFGLPEERLIKVRDLFILMCCTGTAYEDISSPQTKIISYGNEKYLSGYRQKTKVEFKVKLSGLAGEIVAKYGGIPPALSNQRMNAYLVELLGIVEEANDWFLACDPEGHLSPTAKDGKHHVLGSHSARRSFITGHIIKGTPREILEAMGGFQKNSKELSTYYNESRLHAASRISEPKQARQRAVKPAKRVRAKRPFRAQKPAEQ
jgi:hypothetical protein